MKKLIVVLLFLILVCSIGGGIHSCALSAKATEEIAEVKIAPSLLAEESLSYESTVGADGDLAAIPTESSEAIPSDPGISENETLVYQDLEAEHKVESSVSYDEVSETVYATTGVNVRIGPDTSCEKLGMIYRGNSITRTGIGSNGWSRVIYNGSTAYIHSDYLSTTKLQSEWRAGMYGRLTIPSVGIDVGLYYCTFTSGSKAQKIVNAADSAAFIDQDYVDGAIIADHYNQGFEAMKQAVPNQTYAYIDYGSYTQTYVCTAIGIGHNYDNDLVDWNGVSLNYDYISGGLAMYTCNENWQNVTISYWKAV